MINLEVRCVEKFMIQTKGLTKAFKKKKVVENLDLQIKEGEIYGFLGPNGAGKSTTIRMLLGLARPSSGTIEMFGKNLQDNKSFILKKTGSLVESPSYYGHLTAYENLEVLRRLLEIPKSRIDEVLSIVRLNREAKRPVKGFSLGMKQRLGIAAAMLGNPELLILDEPTNGLDPSGIHEIRELIRSLPKEHGTTVLVSSHLLSEIDLMATQLGIIAKGQLVFQNSIEEIRKKSMSRIGFHVNNPEEVKTLINSSHAVNEEGIVYVDYLADAKVAAMIDVIVSHKYEIYRVQEEKKSLEEIFLTITNGEASL